MPHLRGHPGLGVLLPTYVGLTPGAGPCSASPPVHPHVREAHAAGGDTSLDAAGPSPHAWGSRPPRGGRVLPCRSIPTCVGLTRALHHLAALEQRLNRSIPTCVGLTIAQASLTASSPVHPHVRGAHRTFSNPLPEHVGPSPRAWGSHPLPLPRPGAARSIPTCVGLTTRSWSRVSRRPVHPHVRGAHVPVGAEACSTVGPSPRAWGSPDRPPGRRRPDRSIPTCVGLTSTCGKAQHARPVHPHVRGAHETYPVDGPSVFGPSPRAWGSRDHRRAGWFRGRSIPTCVGLTIGCASPWR